MIATKLHHAVECPKPPPLRVPPDRQPSGVGWTLYRCPSCSAVATTERSAP